MDLVDRLAGSPRRAIATIAARSSFAGAPNAGGPSGLYPSRWPRYPADRLEVLLVRISLDGYVMVSPNVGMQETSTDLRLT